MKTANTAAQAAQTANGGESAGHSDVTPLFGSPNRCQQTAGYVTEEVRQWIEGKWVTMPPQADPLQQGREIVEKILSETKSIVFINIAQGRPQAKAMWPILRNGIQAMWFNTDSTSKRIKQIQEDPVTTIYAYDMQRVEGVMLSGKAYVETDEKIRMQAWEKATVTEYEGGVNSPDFQVIRFETQDVNCFFEGTSVSFSVV
jgi:general stress protein 26